MYWYKGTSVLEELASIFRVTQNGDTAWKKYCTGKEQEREQVT
jgi:hypothetical protein